MAPPGLMGLIGSSGAVWCWVEKGQVVLSGVLGLIGLSGATWCARPAGSSAARGATQAAVVACTRPAAVVVAAPHVAAAVGTAPRTAVAAVAPIESGVAAAGVVVVGRRGCMTTGRMMDGRRAAYQA